MSDSVTRWLDHLGLGQYAEAFQQNAIELEHLPDLDHETLKEIGVLAVGHRISILKAAADARIQAGDEALPEADTSPPHRLSSDEAERRHLTVMMCDLVDSTALSARLDPEDLRETIHAYQDACATAIARYDGFIARYVGDGILAYFGYPHAHEDDAERAARAGLDVVAAIVELDARLRPVPDLPLAVRVGIATGLVVVGDLVGEGASQESAVLGETPNVAARLQGLADPNTVLLSPQTRQLLGERFEFSDLGEHELRGLAQLVRAWQLRSIRELEPDLQGLGVIPMAPLVGREEEVGLLLRRWEQAKDGESRVLVLSGEGGIGKSRILQEFQDCLGKELRNRILYFGSPYHLNSAFHPVINQLERGFRFDKTDDSERRYAKIEATLHDLGLSVDEHAPAIAALLSLPTGNRHPPGTGTTAAETKQRILQALLCMTQAMAEKNPVLMVFEDLHWIDPSTREFIDLAIRQLQSTRLFIVITSRPEFDSPWNGQTHVTSLSLSRLARKESKRLVNALMSGKRWSDDLLDQIVEKTDGVPLFVEELTKTLLESASSKSVGSIGTPVPLPSTLSIPESLQDSLMERLDRLGAAKNVAQVAAVVGRRFSEELLTAVSRCSGEQLSDALAQLVRSGLIYKHGAPSNAIYSFKHALVRDTAYQSLLKSARAEHHRRIACVLEEEFPTVTKTEPELLAHHFTEGGLAEKGIGYWQRAGELAAERSADTEAVSHFERGLELLGTLPESDERDRAELALRLGLGPALSVIKGYGSPEFAENYELARPLCDRVGEASQRFPVVWGLWFAKNQTGQLTEASALADELLVIGRSQTDTGILLEAHHSAWTTSFAGGDLGSALEHTKQGVALYDIVQHGSHAMLYGGHDPGVCCRFFRGITLTLLGYLDQGLDWNQQAVELAEKLAHQPSIAFALSFKSSVHYLQRDPIALRQCTDQLSTLCTEYGITFINAMATLLRGWSLAAQGKIENGLAQSREGLGAVRATGIQRLSFQLSVLAEVLGWAEKNDEELDVLEEALAMITTTGEERWAPDIYRLKGELLLRESDDRHAAAEKCLEQAIALAREQKARLFELRAVTRLARHWSNQGKIEEARDLLTPVSGWFTEGFGATDLKEVKALLAQLS